MNKSSLEKGGLAILKTLKMTLPINKAKGSIC